MSFSNELKCLVLPHSGNNLLEWLKQSSSLTWKIEQLNDNALRECFFEAINNKAALDIVNSAVSAYGNNLALLLAFSGSDLYLKKYYTLFQQYNPDALSTLLIRKNNRGETLGQVIAAYCSLDTFQTYLAGQYALPNLASILTQANIWGWNIGGIIAELRPLDFFQIYLNLVKQHVPDQLPTLLINTVSNGCTNGHLIAFNQPIEFFQTYLSLVKQHAPDRLLSLLMQTTEKLITIGHIIAARQPSSFAQAYFEFLNSCIDVQIKQEQINSLLTQKTQDGISLIELILKYQDKETFFQALRLIIKNSPFFISTLLNELELIKQLNDTDKKNYIPEICQMLASETFFQSLQQNAQQPLQGTLFAIAHLLAQGQYNPEYLSQFLKLVVQFFPEQLSSLLEKPLKDGNFLVNIIARKYPAQSFQSLIQMVLTHNPQSFPTLLSNTDKDGNTLGHIIAQYQPTLFETYFDLLFEYATNSLSALLTQVNNYNKTIMELAIQYQKENVFLLSFKRIIMCDPRLLYDLTQTPTLYTIARQKGAQFLDAFFSLLTDTGYLQALAHIPLPPQKNIISPVLQNLQTIAYLLAQEKEIGPNYFFTFFNQIIAFFPQQLPCLLNNPLKNGSFLINVIAEHFPASSFQVVLKMISDHHSQSLQTMVTNTNSNDGYTLGHIIAKHQPSLLDVFFNLVVQYAPEQLSAVLTQKSKYNITILGLAVVYQNENSFLSCFQQIILRQPCLLYNIMSAQNLITVARQEGKKALFDALMTILTGSAYLQALANTPTDSQLTLVNTIQQNLLLIAHLLAPEQNLPYRLLSTFFSNITQFMPAHMPSFLTESVNNGQSLALLIARHQPVEDIEYFFYLLAVHVPNQLRLVFRQISNQENLGQIITARNNNQICQFFFQFLLNHQLFDVLLSYLTKPAIVEKMDGNTRGFVIYQALYLRLRISNDNLTQLKPYKGDVLNHICSLDPHTKLGALKQTLDLDTALGEYFDFPQTSCCGLFSKENPMKKTIKREIRILNKNLAESTNVEQPIDVPTKYLSLSTPGK